MDGSNGWRAWLLCLILSKPAFHFLCLRDSCSYSISCFFLPAKPGLLLEVTNSGYLWCFSPPNPPPISTTTIFSQLRAPAVSFSGRTSSVGSPSCEPEPHVSEAGYGVHTHFMAEGAFELSFPSSTAVVTDGCHQAQHPLQSSVPS